jgi:uncharacterized protein YecE (DUF72 family)
MAKLFVGTSGYSYRHWEHGVFYPVGLSRKEQLRHYSEFFGTVELNSPFYHLPSESAFLRWHEEKTWAFFDSTSTKLEKESRETGEIHSDA